MLHVRPGQPHGLSKSCFRFCLSRFFLCLLLDRDGSLESTAPRIAHAPPSRAIIRQTPGYLVLLLHDIEVVEHRSTAIAFCLSVTSAVTSGIWQQLQQAYTLKEERKCPDRRQRTTRPALKSSNVCTPWWCLCCESAQHRSPRGLRPACLVLDGLPG